MDSSEKTLPQENLLFEPKDLAIFKIPDTKARLNALQNYFFPRLDILLTQSLELVQEIYRFNPYERLTILRTPNHRKDAKRNKEDRPFVRIGVGGKRRTDRPLKVLRKDGQPYRLHNGRLYYLIEPSGEISVYLWLLGDLDLSLNAEFLAVWRDLLADNIAILNSIFALNHISHPDARYFLNFTDTLNEEFVQHLDSLQFFSPTYFLPISFDRGLFQLQMVFAALYPLLIASIECEEGQPISLVEMLEAYINWYTEDGAVQWYQKYSESHLEQESDLIELPELDSYHFIRAGLWWEILARDNWTCCSCGRTVKEHGITLHVDHILPRSKGGTDNRENLQALCMKCNIGKSNRDHTDLTRKSQPSTNFVNSVAAASPTAKED
jgi:hypothetical protein